MKESGYYAPGTEFDPRAPWNQVDPPEREFDCEAIVNLSRTATVTTQSLYLDDEVGCWVFDKENADLRQDYRNCYASIPELMDELVKYIDGELQGDVSSDRRWELQRLKDSATGWQVDDEDYSIY